MKHTKKRDIAVIGLSTVDCIGTAGDCKWNIMNPVHDLRITAGGLGNALTALSGLGLEVGVATRIGKDLYGDFLLQQWNAQCIDVSAVTQDKARATGYAFLVNHGTERTPFYTGGANEAFCLEDIPENFGEESRCALVMFAHALPALDGAPMVQLFQRCHRADTAIILDVSDSTQANYSDLISYFPYVNLVVNTEEGRRITGKERPLEALESLYQMTVKNRDKRLFQAITRSNGASVTSYREGEPIYYDVPSPFYGKPVHNVIGAGDAFRAGLAAFICLHYDDYNSGQLNFENAFLFASAVSYLYLSRNSDIRPFSLEDVRALLSALT